MNVKEIISRLNKGETVVIPVSYAFVFMRECERHLVSSVAISMIVDGEKCTLTHRSTQS